MLTFTRKNRQSVVIQVAGHAPLTVTLLGSRTGKCQLAFDGPQDYRILREELTFHDPPSYTNSIAKHETERPTIVTACAT